MITTKRTTSILLSIALMIACCVLLLASCTSGDEPALIISQSNSSIGAADEQGNVQKFSFSFTLQNQTDEDIYIAWIEPLLHTELAARTLGELPRYETNGTLPAGVIHQISDELTFDATGLSKTDIIAWDPLIAGVRVGIEQTVPMAGVK